MYSSEKNPGFNWKDLIVKIVFFVLFILLLLWLFPKTPNMKPFYSNVFRENISYMQDAAESYYTNERLPKEVGESAEMTLQDMIDKNLIVPFVDKDGKSCNTKESYVQITKEENEYLLKVNLVCDDESSYILKTLGCYDYCENDICEKQEETKKVTEYQFKKSYTTTKTVLLDTIKRTQTVKEPYTYEETTTKPITTTKYKTEYKTETYTCTKTEQKEDCTTTNVKKAYDCDCKTKFINGKYTYSCNTCYKTVPEKTCSMKDVVVEGTCTRQVAVQVPYTETIYETVTETKTGYKDTLVTKYSCPSQTTEQSGSGASLKCYGGKKTVTGYTYKWSTSKTLDGWTFTGKTRTKEVSA